MEGRRRLGRSLAGPAAELLPHMFGDEQLPRHDVEVSVTSSPIFESLVAVATRTAGRSGMPTMRRRVAGDREKLRRVLAPREALHRDAGGLDLVLAARRGQFLELQSSWSEQTLAALGARARTARASSWRSQLQVLDQRFRRRRASRASRFNAACSALLSSGRGSACSSPQCESITITA